MHCLSLTTCLTDKDDVFQSTVGEEGHPLPLAFQEGVGRHCRTHSDPFDARGVDLGISRETAASLIFENSPNPFGLQSSKMLGCISIPFLKVTITNSTHWCIFVVFRVGGEEF